MVRPVHLDPSPAPRDPRGTMAVLGGSFNPPHLGHVLLPGFLLARGDADRVLVAPCADHPLGKSLAPFVRRMTWARLAFAHHDERVEVSEIEAELAGARAGRPSYTLELLEALAERHPDVRVRLVVGSDIVQSGETARWHRWDAIVERFDPIVVPRAGWSTPGEAALPEISSTAVRAQLDRLRNAAGPDDPEAALARTALAGMVPGAVLRSLLGWIAGDEPRVWVIGHGHVATHVCPWLRERGFVVEQIGARALLQDPSVLPSEPPAGVWVLARDDGLRELARALVDRLPARTPVLHAAGARLASDVLAPLQTAGHPVGTLHPICSLRSERARAQLHRASFGVAGDPQARRFAMQLIGDAPVLDIHLLDARGRMAYHGACALVSNHLAVIEAQAAAVLRQHGLPPRAVDRALGQLMLGSLENLLALGIPAGITGPLARGDRATVAAHLAAFDDPATRTLYADLSERLASLFERSTTAIDAGA